ncbi:MAG: hypothetical protein AAFX87_16270 [Bacteroidota bacterium]
MRKVLIIALAVMLSGPLCAQRKLDVEGSRSTEYGKLITDLNVKKDIYSRVKILKKEKTYGLIKGSVHFKTIDIGGALLGKGQGRTNVVSYAILDGLSDEDFQEIADQFHASFSEKLSKLGLTELDWAKIQSSKKFPKLLEKQQEKEESSKSVGSYKVVTVGDHPHFKVPMGNLSVFNNMKAISKEVGAPLMSYDVIIDFARFDVEASRWRTEDYGYGYDVITTNTSANILPQIGIEHILQDKGTTMPIVYFSGVNVLDQAGRYDDIRLLKSLYYRENYAVDIDTYKGEIPKAMKKMITVNTDNLGTFVVKADPEKYKRIALQALDAFADYMINAIKSEFK